MEYYAAPKRNEIQTQAIVWMDLKDIMLKEISQNKPDIKG